MSNILFLINSDLWWNGTFWNRLPPILSELENDKAIRFKVIARQSFLSNKHNQCWIIITPIPFWSFLVKIIKWFQIFIWNRFPSKLVRIKIFEFFAKRIISKEKFDVVHTWEYYPNLFKLLKKMNPDVIMIKDVSISPSLSWKKMFKYNSWIDYINHFIAPSDFAKTNLINSWISWLNISIIPFWVDLNKFKPIRKILSNSIRFAFSWVIEERKWIRYLIEAWKEVSDWDIQLHLYWKVYPNAKKYLNDINKYNIYLHWFVDLSKELAKNDVFVFPSLLEWSAKSVYEAMACAMPVITTYNSWSIVVNWKQWFIIPISNSNEIKNKIKYFINNKNEINEMWQSARHLVENYSWKSYWKNIHSMYKRIIRINE